jgi:Type II secretion system (T2SS), protein E, N-terminal domain
MAPMLFGECLGKVVRLTPHDVAEIMEHQAATRRKFGEIALAWGLCRPQHVWQAWWDQLSRQTKHVDLTKIGVDSQAVAHVSAKLAVEFRAIPLRSYRDQLVVATCEKGITRARAELPGLLPGKQVQFVLTEPEQLDLALAAYYPSAFRPTAAVVA